LANIVRHHKELKQREGLFNHNRAQFFRYKRMVRALQSDEYKKKRQAAKLSPILNDVDAMKIFVVLIKNKMVLPVEKISTKEAREKDLKPVKDYPTLVLKTKASLTPDEYYVWNYNPTKPKDIIYGILVLILILTIVLFPLWPPKMRLLVYYISVSLMGLIGAFFGLAIVRLIVYIISYFILPKGFWIFPNLFADCGFVESFIPLYGWDET
ncbi:Sec63 complex subunit SEC62, partial [Ascoidea rubescens DSM 1968]